MLLLVILLTVVNRLYRDYSVVSVRMVTNVKYIHGSLITKLCVSCNDEHYCVSIITYLYVIFC